MRVAMAASAARRCTSSRIRARSRRSKAAHAAPAMAEEAQGCGSAAVLRGGAAGAVRAHSARQQPANSSSAPPPVHACRSYMQTAAHTESGSTAHAHTCQWSTHSKGEEHECVSRVQSPTRWERSRRESAQRAGCSCTRTLRRTAYAAQLMLYAHCYPMLML